MAAAAHFFFFIAISEGITVASSRVIELKGTCAVGELIR